MATLQKLLDRMAAGVARDDLSSQYTDFLSAAQKQICRRRSFNWMRGTAPFVMGVGSSQILFSSLFKELQERRDAVRLLSNGAYSPAQVLSREEILRWPQISITQPLVVYLDWYVVSGSKVRTLNLQPGQTAGSNLTFEIDYFSFPDDFGSDTAATNFLTQEYPDMLVAKAKALALATINDPAAGDNEEVFEKLFRDAASYDAHTSLTGRALRM